MYKYKTSCINGFEGSLRIFQRIEYGSKIKDI